MTITAEQFLRATGREPEDDDLERCNCDMAGRIGHWSCGWCKLHDKPEFWCGCTALKLASGKRQ